MSNYVHYKGYIICPRPHELVEGGWSQDLTIRIDTGHQVQDKRFSAANTYPTEEEAIKHCINMGRQIIDGKVPGLTVDNL